MASNHTHYDNLKVAHNAPPEVIRAAYRTLSQKFHSDRNPDNPEAARIMGIINASYAVLSDPVKRQEHDLWIVKQGQTDHASLRSNPSAQSATFPDTHNRGANALAHVLRNWFVYLILGFVIWALVTDHSSPPPPGPKPYQASPPPKAAYVRPTTAPNGKPWPQTAAYVDGYQQLHRDGLSSVTIDNSRNDSDVFVKLVSLDGAEAYPIRQFYIPAHGSFSVKKVKAGTYDIRYRDLGDGGLSRSEGFELKETPTYNGTQFSNITMTLYKVQHGNMQTHRLSEAEF